LRGKPGTGNDPWLVVVGICILLPAAVWLAFGQAVDYEFVNYDDDEYVTKNAPVTRGLTFNGIAWAFTTVHAANWHPITWISHMMDCHFYGLSSGGHHLTNILFHGLTAILLFLVLRQMTGSLWRSAFVAALFAIHPLRVESVAWVAERKDVLSGVFFMLTTAAYVRYAQAPWSTVRYGLVVLPYALGLMCKPMLVSVPLVFLLLDYWPLDRLASSRTGANGARRIPRRLVLEKLPLLALGLTSCVVTLLAQHGAMQPVTRMPLSLRLSNALVSYADYTRQMFWPVDMAVLYPWETIRLGASHLVPSLMILAAISAVVFILRRQRYLITGWLWYLVMLIPVIGILQVGNQARADRYTYLPQIGLYLMLAWGISDLCANLPNRRVILSSLSAVILTALIFVTRAQSAHWRDSESLWSHALECTTSNTVAEGLLGEAYHVKGKMPEALVHFERALAIEPKQPSVQSSLGVYYLEMGKVDESLDHLKKALEIEPNFADAHYNIANTYLRMGRVADALSHYRKAIEINPNDVESLSNMAWVLSTSSDDNLRDGARAVVIAERADSLTAHKNPLVGAMLAAAYAESGRFPEALTTAQRALAVAVSQGDTHRADSIRTQIRDYQSGTPFRANR
jgi:tetratricopeptide (TPR) repeat protein